MSGEAAGACGVAGSSGPGVALEGSAAPPGSRKAPPEGGIAPVSAFSRFAVAIAVGSLFLPELNKVRGILTKETAPRVFPICGEVQR